MNIYQSITKIMEEVPSIGKNQKNKTQNFMYRERSRKRSTTKSKYKINR